MPTEAQIAEARREAARKGAGLESTAVTTMPVEQYRPDPADIAEGQRIQREGARLPEPAGRGRIPAPTWPMGEEAPKARPRPTTEPFELPPWARVPETPSPAPPKGPSWTPPKFDEATWQRVQRFGFAPEMGPAAVAAGLVTATVLAGVARQFLKTAKVATDTGEALHKLVELRDGKPLGPQDLSREGIAWLTTNRAAARTMWLDGIIDDEAVKITGWNPAGGGAR